MFKKLVGEVFGTFILILLGDGVVANVGLAPRLASTAYNWNTITIGWAFAVIVAVYVSAGVSGAHLNPAVTIALALKRGFPWGEVVPYIIAQIVGAFLGALAVYLVYGDGFRRGRHAQCLVHRARFRLWTGLLGRGLNSCQYRLLLLPGCLHHRGYRNCRPAVGHFGQRQFQEYRLDAQPRSIPGWRHRFGCWSFPGRPQRICHQSCS